MEPDASDSDCSVTDDEAEPNPCRASFATMDLIDETAQKQHRRDPARSEAEWRALLLCARDRWGMYTNAKKTLKQMGLWDAIDAAHRMNEKLRVRLASRDDTMRVQAQRILVGPSLLAITRSRSPEHNVALNGLLAAMIHPAYGVEGYKVKDLDSIPLMLPSLLQPELPSLPDRRTEATALNKLFAVVFDAMRTPSADDPIRHFVERHELASAEGRRRFGKLPSRWDRETHGFESVLPDAKPGDVLVWKTWHATGGARSDAQGAKLVAFLDMVPRSFLSDDLYLWYRYATSHAPMDPGAGKSRGAWLSLVHQLKRGDTANAPLGLATDGWQKRGAPILTDAQTRELRERGCLVLTPPADLAGLAEESARNFQAFFRDVSGFQLRLDKASGPHSVSAMFERGLKVTGSAMVTPSDPFKVDGLEKSRNAQRGGAIITMSAGMGAGTTYCNEPAHVRFQTSQYAADLMASAGGAFYANELLLPVWERFRLKDQAVWAKATHVDTRLETMIPTEVRRHWDGVRRAQAGN